MKAQAQLYDDADYVRLFDEKDKMIADAKLHGNAKRTTMADNALDNTAFRRTGRWRPVQWGFVCSLTRRTFRL